MRSVTDLRLAIAFVIAAAAGSALAHAEPPAQAGTAQPLNMTVPVVNGTGAISGIVTDATTKNPVPGVAVYLGPPNRGPVGQPTLQLSDAQGRFVFRDLPPSEAYFINATKPGYFDGHVGPTTSMQLGARIVVADRQWVDDVHIVMSRSAALSGAVTDEYGDPVVGAYVRAMAEVLIAGQPQLVASSVATTDDRGVYRISGLPAGKYLVHVPIVQESVPATISTAELAGLTPQSLATLQRAGRPMPAVDPTMAVDANTHLVIGRYPAATAPGAARPLTYPSMFYPNARLASAAVPIQLTPGEDRSGLDIRLDPVPGWRISGVVQGPAEMLTHLAVRLLLPGMEDLGDGSEAATALVRPDGTFTFLNVPAGVYTIDARRSFAQFAFSNLASPTKALPRPAGTPSGGTAFALVEAAPQGTRIATRVPGGVDDGYAGRARVAVTDQDLANIVVTLQRGVRMTGRFVWDGKPPPSGPPLVMAEPARGQASLGYPRSQATSVLIGKRPDSFSIDGLLSGEYVLRFGGGSVKSVIWDGRDYTYTPFDASAGRDFTDVIVTLTSQSILLAGTVRDDRGAVSKTAAVIVFPVERDQWSAYGFAPPRIGAASVNTAGLYRFQRLPAGTYYVIGVDDSKIDAWQDPQFLEAASRSATRITLDWGANATQDLILSQVR
jgi:hypothetical protein